MINWTRYRSAAVYPGNGSPRRERDIYTTHWLYMCTPPMGYKRTRAREHRGNPSTRRKQASARSDCWCAWWMTRGGIFPLVAHTHTRVCMYIGRYVFCRGVIACDARFFVRARLRTFCSCAKRVASLRGVYKLIRTLSWARFFFGGWW